LNGHTTHTHPAERHRRPRRGQGGHPIRQGNPAGAVPASPPNIEPAACAITSVPFASLNLDPRLLEGISDLGFTDTRPIQSAVIAPALAAEDVIACAETGTGKTVAFAVPMLQRLLRVADAHESIAGQPEPPTPEAEAGVERKMSRALVLAPTRELAVQIEDEVHGLSYHTRITSAAVYGGVDMSIQERALRAGVDIIVATPGRLLDHLRQGNAELGCVELLVLDEADRMMDMGFWPDVQRIIASLPAARQTMLFSATMPDEVMRLALEIVRSPRYVQVGRRSAPPATITHRAHVMAPADKLQWLVGYLRRAEGPVLIFTRTKIGADRLSQRLGGSGIRSVALHADRTMDQRRKAVEGFRGGKYRVLVATDVAARGLDIDGIHTVINYEMPHSSDDYVHRVGRTGRSEEAGQAITLVTPEERRKLALLEKSVGIRLELEP
jgi:ATP-dependent RNA helicase RhlE